MNQRISRIRRETKKPFKKLCLIRLFAANAAKDLQGLDINAQIARDTHGLVDRNALGCRIIHAQVKLLSFKDILDLHVDTAAGEEKLADPALVHDLAFLAVRPQADRG